MQVKRKKQKKNKQNQIFHLTSSNTFFLITFSPGFVSLYPIIPDLDFFSSYNRLRVPIPVLLLENRKKIRGTILSDQVRCLDWRVRKAEFICKLPGAVTAEVLEKLALLLQK